VDDDQKELIERRLRCLFEEHRFKVRVLEKEYKAERARFEDMLSTGFIPQRIPSV